ncbi:MAG: hypothetical protein ABSD57_09470 [Verrucomicrobiota bacterium]
MNTTTQNSPQSNPPVNPVLKLGLDVDLQQITVTVQGAHQHPKEGEEKRALVKSTIFNRTQTHCLVGVSS